MIARHDLAPAGAGVMVRDHGHVLALEQAAMTAASPAAPHRRKQRIPPGPAALAAADALRAAAGKHRRTAPPSEAVIDLARYAAAARGRNTLTTYRHHHRRSGEHPMPAAKTVTPGPARAPATPAQASLYQQLRGHLAELKLHDAAEALPAVLDQASTRA